MSNLHAKVVGAGLAGSEAPVHCQRTEIVAYLRFEYMAGMVRAIVEIAGTAIEPVVCHRNAETAGTVAQRQVQFFRISGLNACGSPCTERKSFVGNGQ